MFPETIIHNDSAHSANSRPENVLGTSPKSILWTFPYVPLCNAKGRPLSTSWERPLPTSLGRWNMTSQWRPNVTSWKRPHTVLCVTPWDFPYRRLEDFSCRCYEDVPIQSNVYLQETCPTDVLRMSLPQRRLDVVLKTFLHCSLFYK